jgi:excisionase family DNA binding protein
MTDMTDPSVAAATENGHPLSVAAAAMAMGVSERTIRRWIAQGQLPAQRHGHSWLIAPDVLATCAAVHGHIGQDGHGHDQDAATTATAASVRPATATRVSAMAEWLALVQDLQARLADTQQAALQKGEAAAYWQGRAEVLAVELERTRERVLLLEAPRPAEGAGEQKTTDGVTGFRPWWARLAWWRH